MRKVLMTLVTATFVLAMAWSAYSATATQTLTINASVTARAELTLSNSAISFAASDPTTVTSIASNPAAITVTAKAQATKNSNVTLVCKANGDLATIGDTDSIGIANVTWTASGTGFVAGTMNSATAQSVASWVGSGTHTGTLNFFLANSWNWGVGEYSQTVLYTLTAL